METNKNKKYYLIDMVAKENGKENYFLFSYNMLINGCRYVPFNECTLYDTYEKVQKRCKEFNEYYKKGCPLDIIVSPGHVQIVQLEGEEVENRYVIQEIGI